MNELDREETEEALQANDAILLNTQFEKQEIDDSQKPFIPNPTSGMMQPEPLVPEDSRQIDKPRNIYEQEHNALNEEFRAQGTPYTKEEPIKRYGAIEGVVKGSGEVFSRESYVGSSLTYGLNKQAVERWGHWKDPNFDPTADEYVPKFQTIDERYWPSLISQPNQYAFEARLEEIQFAESMKEVSERAAWWQQIPGYIGATLVDLYLTRGEGNFVMTSNAAKQLVSGNLRQALTNTAVKPAAWETMREAMLHTNQENRTIQESLIGIGLVGGVGGALGVYGKYTDGKHIAQMKELVQKAHEGMTVKFAANAKGEATGFNVYRGGDDSAGAAKNKAFVKHYDFKDLAIHGTGENGEFSWLAGPFIKATGTLFKSPVIKGLMSKSVSMRRFTAGMLENNLDIAGDLIGKVRRTPLQQSIAQKIAKDTVDVDVWTGEGYLKHLGINVDEQNILVANAQKWLKNKNMTLDQFSHEISKAVREGGESPYPVVSEVAKKIITEKMEPLFKKMVEQGHLREGIKAFGTSKHWLHRKYDKDYISQNFNKAKMQLADAYEDIQNRIAKEQEPYEALRQKIAALKEGKRLKALSAKGKKLEKEILNTEQVIKKIKEDIKNLENSNVVEPISLKDQKEIKEYLDRVRKFKNELYHVKDQEETIKWATAEYKKLIPPANDSGPWVRSGVLTAFEKELKDEIKSYFSRLKKVGYTPEKAETTIKVIEVKISQLENEIFRKTPGNDKVIARDSLESVLIETDSELAILKEELANAESKKPNVEKLERQLKRITKDLNQKMRDGEIPEELLVGERGLATKELKQYKSLRKESNAIKLRIKQLEEENSVISRAENKGRKPGQANKPLTERQNQLEMELKLAKEDLNAFRQKLQQGVESGAISRNVARKGFNGRYYLNKKNLGSLQFRKIVDRDQLEESADATLTRILNLSPEQMAEEMQGLAKSGGGADFLKERTLLLPDKLLDEMNFLEKDIRKTLDGYFTSAHRLTEKTDFLIESGWRGKQAPEKFFAEELDADYKALRFKMDADYKKKLEKVSGKEKEKLDKKYNQAQDELTKSLQEDKDTADEIWKRITGAAPLDHKGMTRLFRFSNKWLNATALNSLILLMLQDFITPAFKVGWKNQIMSGLIPYVGRAIIPGMKGNAAFKREARNFALAQETVMAFYGKSWNVASGDVLPKSFRLLGLDIPAEHYMDVVARIQSVWNLSAPMADMTLTIGGIAAQASIVDYLTMAAKGTLTKKGVRFLAQAGIDPKSDTAKSILEQLSVHKQRLSGSTLSNTQLWSDPEAVKSFSDAVYKTVKGTIFGGPNPATWPLALDDHRGRSASLMKFMGYGFTAIHNYLLPTLQGVSRGELDRLSTLMMMVMISSTVEPLRAIGQGRKPDLDPAHLLIGGIMNSGIFGTYTDLYNKANYLADLLPHSKTDRFKYTRGLLNAAPEVLFVEGAKTAGMLLNADVNKKDVTRILKQVLPMTDAYYMKPVTRKFVESLKIPDKRTVTAAE